MRTQEDRLAIIRGLLAKAEGTTHQEEARAFSAKAEELMTQAGPMIGEKTRFTSETGRSAVAAREAKKAEARSSVEARIAEHADAIVDAMIDFALSDSGSAIAKQQARSYLLDRLMGSPTQKVETLHMERIDAEIEALVGEMAG